MVFRFHDKTPLVCGQSWPFPPYCVLFVHVIYQALDDFGF